MLVDLHVHSSESDGTLTPTNLIDLAVKNRISVIALTDHDTIAGIQEGEKAAKEKREQGHTIRLIPGTELSVSYKEKDIHMLGLFLNPDNKALGQALENARIRRNERNERMAANFRNAGIPITINELRQTVGEGVLTRAHFAKYLIKHGYVSSLKEAFRTYLNTNSPYYVPREYFSPEQAINLIHGANGLAIIAHPLLYHFTEEEVEEMVSDFVVLGIDGIEAIYSSNTVEDEKKMLHLARKYNLLISGGTDFHGANKPSLDIGYGKGNMRIPYRVFEELEEKVI